MKLQKSQELAIHLYKAARAVSMPKQSYDNIVKVARALYSGQSLGHSLHQCKTASDKSAAFNCVIAIINKFDHLARR